MKNIFITIFLAIILVVVFFRFMSASAPLLYQDAVWYYVDQQTGVNYVVLGKEAITPRVTRAGELYISK